jgi:hypothetical protein
MSDSDYSHEEFYRDFIQDFENPDKPTKLLTQRIGKQELIALVAKACRYPKHEVEDVLQALWDTINFQLEQGREFDFGGMFTARLYKPFARRLWDNNLQDFKISSARPRLKLVPTDAYARYLHKGIHAPVNYFPAEKLRGQDKPKEVFTMQWQQAYSLWEAEDKRRKAKDPTNESGIAKQS